MSRLWIGIGILLILLAMGVGLLWGSRAFFEDFSRDLDRAGEAALAGDWAAAAEAAGRGQARWEHYRRFWAAFTDHEPVEQMQDLFSRLEVYRQRQLDADFAIVCRSIVLLAEAIDESHNLRWWSVL